MVCTNMFDNNFFFLANVHIRMCACFAVNECPCSCTQIVTQPTQRCTESLLSLMKPTESWARTRAGRSTTPNSGSRMLKVRPLALPPVTPLTTPGKHTHTHTLGVLFTMHMLCPSDSLHPFISKHKNFNSCSLLSFTYSRENLRYWEQFHHAHTQEMSAEQWQKRRRRNLHLVGYCVVAMLLSIGVHVVFFR